MISITLSAFQCDGDGISEAYSSYNWAQQIARFANVKLLTTSRPAGLPANVEVLTSGRPFTFATPYLANFNRAVKFDYFWHDLLCRIRHKELLSSTDIFHFVTPQAPRYPSSLGRLAGRFVLGPIGGGLRVPPSFRERVEQSEPVYSVLRKVDNFRLRYDPALRKTYQAAKKILINAKYMLDILPEEFHAKTEILLETGINGADYPEEGRPAKGKGFILLYVGRIVPYKGLEFLIRALGEVNGGIQQSMQLHVIGDGGAYAQECQRLARQLDLHGRITFHGRLSRDQVMQWYRKADVFCLPTLAETTGNVILEAMAMRLPVISVNYGGPSAVIGRDSGILIDPVSPQYLISGIAAALERLAVNAEYARALGAAARRRVLGEFAWEAKGRKLAAIYEEMMAESLAHHPLLDAR